MNGRRERGMALVLVLWLTTLLTVMAATFALNARRETNLLRVARNSAQGAALCEGAIHYALGRLAVTNPLLKWRADGTVYEVVYGGSRVRVQLLDEAAKVDLNAAQDGLLQGLLVAAGLGPDAATRMANAILDWRDADQLRRLQGAEAEDYRLAGRNFGPRNKPFYAVEELQTVLDMTTELYQRLEPWVTVYSRRPGIDPRVAPADLLRRLPGMDAYAVESYLQARALAAAAAPSATPGQPQAQTPLPQLQPPPNIPFTSGSQRNLGARAEAMTGDDATVTVDAVVGLGRMSGRGALSIFRWREQAGAGSSLFKQNVADSVILELPPP